MQFQQALNGLLDFGRYFKTNGTRIELYLMFIQRKNKIMLY